MEMAMKNKMRDFGVFMALQVLPIFMAVFGITTAIKRVMDFTAGLIPLFPADLLMGGGFVFSLIGCVVLVLMGAFFFWAALSVYKEHING